MLLLVDVVMWSGVIVCGALAVRGIVNWRSGGQDDVCSALLGVLAPAIYLFGGVVSNNDVRFGVALVWLVGALDWRIRLSRKGSTRAAGSA
jgi:hypothetical protein